MEANPESSRRAWQPLTPRGVAAFARATLRRLLLFQFGCAALLAAAAVWFADTAWFPAVRAALRRLPAQGDIRAGRLNWPAASPQRLAENDFLAFAVDLNHSGLIRSPAHVQVEFGRRDARFISLLGETDCAYPDGRWIIAFNRTELEPWWGAWRPPILWMTAGALAIGLPVLWALVATVYSFPVWLMGFYANRELRPWQCWKLSGAALMPGALLLTAALGLYGAGVVDLIQFTALFVAHGVAGVIYAAVGVWNAPRLASAAAGKGNPFAPTTSGPRAAGSDADQGSSGRRG